MKDRQGVVIRHLEHNRPTVLCTIPQPKNESDLGDSYFKEIAIEKIKAFKAQFVEFRTAKFYLDMVDRYGVPMSSRELTEEVG